MFTEERQKIIEQYIIDKGSVSVLELSGRFGVSEVTIRKDLEELQKGEYIIRTHGGAMIKYPSLPRPHFQELVVKCQEEKLNIARKAMEYIDDGDAIILDGSTTVNELAALVNASSLKHLTVVTTSITTAQLFNGNDEISVLLIGGFLNKRMNTVEGSVTEEQLRGITVDKCFMGMDGIDNVFGFSTTGFMEAAVKRAICQASNRCFVLIDHTKFNKKYFSKVFDLNGDVDYVITGRRHKSIDYKKVEEQLELIFAEE